MSAIFEEPSITTKLEKLRTVLHDHAANMDRPQRQQMGQYLIDAGRVMVKHNGGVDPVQALEDELAAVKAGQK